MPVIAPLKLSILYRGPLSSCNYDCHYCPFAKRTETTAELKHDAEALARFSDWIVNRAETHPDDRFSILFTPWGEGLVRSWYRQTMLRLSHLKNVPKVAIQTNLSCSLGWLDGSCRNSLALWCTWHPSEVRLETFVARCQRLDAMSIRYSVGLVGIRENWQAALRLREQLPNNVYLWVNAYKDEPNYYRESEIRDWKSIDPLFGINLIDHDSLGCDCRAGSTTISVAGDGTIRRCHFIPEKIGNLYAPDFAKCLHPRPCSNKTCGCHIGYVHLQPLNLQEVFGDGMLERIPQSPLWQRMMADA